MLLVACVLVSLLPGCAFHRKLQSVFGGYGLPDDANTIPETAQAAAVLAPGQPRPAWQDELAAREVDILHFLSPDKVLVGTLEVTNKAQVKFNYAHVGKEVMLVDVGSGRVVWRVEREATRYPQAVVATSPVIVLRHDGAALSGEQRDTTLNGLDPGSGKELWHYSAPGPISIASDPANGLAVIGSWNGSRYRLAGLNLRNGKESWARNIGGIAARDGLPRLMNANGSFVLIGRKVVRLSPSDGALMWETQFPGVWGEQVVTLGASKGLLLGGGNMAALIDPQKGSTALRVTAGGSVRVLSMDAAHLFAIVSAGGQERVECYDLRSGQPAWASAPVPSVRSALLVTETAVYFTTADRLKAVNSAAGREVFPSPIPDTIRAPGDPPDALALVNDRIVVATEGGVAAYATATGELAFSRTVQAGFRFSYAYLTERLDEMHRTRSLRVGKSKRPNFSVAIVPAIRTPDFAAAARTHQAMVNAQTAHVLSPGSGASHADRQAAIVQNELAATNTMVAERTQAAMELNNAVIGFAGALASVVAAQEDAMESLHELDLERMLAEVANACWTQVQSVRGHYYLRPFYAEGLRLAIVDLVDGKRFDLVLSPPNRGLINTQIASLPTYALDPDGGRLIACGIGLNASKYKGFEVEQANDISDKSHMFSIPFSSLLAFDMTAIALQSSKDSAASGRPHPSAAEAEFIAAAYRNDTTAMQQALASGVRVDATDAFGRTALIRAVQRNHPEAVELLLKANADIYARDADGLQAWDYNDWIFKQGNFFLSDPGDEKDNFKTVKKLLMKEHERRTGKQ